MKILFLLASLLWFDSVLHQAKAQETKKIFYTKDWKVCPEKEAEYYRVVTLDATGKPVGAVHDYYLSGTLQWEGALTYLDPTANDKDTVDGACTWYWPNGKKKMACNKVKNKLNGRLTEWYEDGKLSNTTHYEMGRKSGPSTSWYENGNKKDSVEYVNDTTHGTFITYWPNGRMRRMDIREQGKVKSGTCWDSTGKNIAYFPYEVDPVFPGGLRRLAEFIQENTNYPRKYRRREIEGRVLVSFVVRKDGTVGDVEITKPDAERFNQEAVRVVKSIPRWTPGTQEGIPVNTRMFMPIIFKMAPR